VLRAESLSHFTPKGVWIKFYTEFYKHWTTTWLSTKFTAFVRKFRLARRKQRSPNLNFVGSTNGPF